MKILVIFTGGTIGSSIKKGWADIDKDTQYLLLSKYCDTDVDGKHTGTDMGHALKKRMELIGLKK